MLDSITDLIVWFAGSWGFRVSVQVSLGRTEIEKAGLSSSGLWVASSEGSSPANNSD